MVHWSQALILVALATAEACTIIAVGKAATVDGSVLVSHTNDAGLNPADLRMVRVPAMNHSVGSMRPIYNFQRNGYPRLISKDRGPQYEPQANESLTPVLGYIPQVPYTYGYFDHDYGMINDHQLSIAESTCAAKTVGWPKSLHYGHNLFQIEELSKIALERCDSARCAIQLMGNLAVEHGFFGEYGKNQRPNYGSSSEALGISDKYGETWIFHMLTGPDNSSAVWAAQRVPDANIAVVANSFVIRTLNLSDPDNYMASDNVESFARDMGWYNPAEGPFDFAAAYSWAKPGPSKPLYGGRRIWRIYDVFAPSLKLDSTLGQHPEVETYPFSIKPDRLLAPRDLMEIMRDHYEGTKYDMTKELAAGPFGNPIRFGGSTKNVSGGWERSISMHRTTHSFVLQARGNLPDEIGGITWYSLGAPHGSVYAPFSCAQSTVPASYLSSRKNKFDTTAAWWAFEFLNNWSMLRYDLIHGDIKVVMNEIQDEAIALEVSTREQAMQIPNPQERINFIESRYNAFAQRMVDRWWQLAFSLIVKFSDGYVVHGDRAGDMKAPGYPAWWLQSTNFGTWPTSDAYNPPAKIVALQSPPHHSITLWVVSAFFAIAGIAIVVFNQINFGNEGEEMDNRDGVVLMYTASPGGTINGPGPGGMILIGRDDQEYQMDMQRGRLQRLLTTTIFVCFFILFLDGTNRSQRLSKKTSHQNTQWPYTDNDTERMHQIQYFKHLLDIEKSHFHPLGHMNKSENVSGIYSGLWAPLLPKDYKAQVAANEVGRVVHPQIQPYADYDANSNRFNSDVASFSPGGVFWLVLSTKPTPVAECNDDVAYVTGQVIMHDKQSTLAITMFNVQGIFLRKVGRLTLYGNIPDARVELVYPTTYPPRANAATAIVASNSTVQNGSLAVDDEQMHFEVSPPRYSIYGNQQQRLRTGQSLVDQCSYTLDMNVETPDKTSAPMVHMHSVAALGGIVGSEACQLYWSANVTYVGENFDQFFSKASHYAIIMAILAMFQIYLLLRQLQISSTQAMAAKVSLLTIGAQAIVDSYLCLAHLTIGIVAQQIFTLFATVSFFELIIFSIFEMRYLLVIWKARRPQNFTQGWLLMRRELTTLYSRFYISLLTGLCLIYYGWHYINYLVFIAFSFWVPQIIHNAHCEVRNPFDFVYVLGMSITRLFLPLYLYGCPKNFLSALPVYQQQSQPEMCYLLVGWVSFQIVMLYLQQKCGPRFFIPARFLPVKYNYERRIDADQMSLLRANQGDEIDCVICMVELDIDARDYMIAPCDHIFHRPCLQEWMQVKMECPTCRCALPEP